MKQLFRMLCCAALALALTGCGSSGKTISFTWFVDEIPQNLDPQLASTSAEVTAANHLYTGLYQMDESGTPQPGCASGHTLSDDGCTYTFTIRPDLYYQSVRGEVTDYAITAEDFVFAFRRIFLPETHSPYATSFAGIVNGLDILAGEKSPSLLGVTSPDPYTLVIRLNEPDPSFLEKLTLPGAMPCDQMYFESTMGTYGLTKKDCLTNGRFYLHNWTSEGMFLRRPAQGDLVNNLRLITNTNPRDMTSVQLVENDKCTAALDYSSEETRLSEISFSNTTWCLRISPEGLFADDALRKALAFAAQDVALPSDSRLYGPVTGLVPDGARVDTLDYRTHAGNALATPVDGDALWQQALLTVPAAKLQGQVLLVPDTADRAFVQTLNGTWQKRYGIFFNVETVDAETFARRYKDGDYTIALAPLPLTESDPTAFLSGFEKAMPPDQVLLYQTMVDEAAQAAGTEKIKLLSRIERLLAEQALVTPLYRQNARVLIDPSVTGLQFDPFGPILDVTWAHGKES